MNKLFFAALMLAFPAYAQLQFDTKSAPPQTEGAVQWLSRQPMTLMDIGLMELTRQASERMQALTGVNGAVAEYIPDANIIRLTLYPSTDYQEDLCNRLGLGVRDQIFPNHTDKAMLASHLGTFFSNYGPQATGRPENIGEELLKITYISVVMKGGGCAMPLDGEKMDHRVDTPPPQASAPPPDKTKEKK
jgi:hypothetical protein